MSSRSAHLLRAAVTFYGRHPEENHEEPAALAVTYESVDEALRTFQRVLLHEARQDMRTPRTAPPSADEARLCAVDLDTEAPGLVEAMQPKLVVLRGSTADPLWYSLRLGADDEESGAADKEEEDTAAATTTIPTRKALAKAATARRRAVRVLETRAARDEAHDERVDEKRAAKETRKRQLASETKEERAQRVATERFERTQRKAETEAKKKATNAPTEETERKGDTNDDKSRPPATAAAAEALATGHAHHDVLPPRKRVRTTASSTACTTFFASPVPADRHLTALQSARPTGALAAAVLRGVHDARALRIVQGPPGTGKSATLVAEVARLDFGRALVCAPTNVVAAQLYERLLAEPRTADEVSICLAPARLPPGTVVACDDPRRRIVVTTVSGRASPRLDAQKFDAVFIDEAGQLMEACAFTLLRPEVSQLVLAGDIHQLPATVSEAGRALGYDASLMARLTLGLGYPARELTVQHRMHPSICAYPNAQFYGGTLRTHGYDDDDEARAAGDDATTGTAHRPYECVAVPEGVEEQVGTSWRNLREAEVCLTEAHAALASLVEHEKPQKSSPPRVVLLCPYQAQCRWLASRRSGFEVHTIDSFQGHEADVVVLSIVRTGEHIGFWSDARRLCVALTRARARLRVVGSMAWPVMPLAGLVADARARGVLRDASAAGPKK